MIRFRLTDGTILEVPNGVGFCRPGDGIISVRSRGNRTLVNLISNRAAPNAGWLKLDLDQTDRPKRRIRIVSSQ